MYIGLDINRSDLRRRIDDRVDFMMQQGLLSEVRGLQKKYGCHVSAMSGIGYRQLCAHVQGDMRLDDAVAHIKRDTRAYAKRQMTWFKRNKRIHWVSDSAAAIELVAACLPET